jgi:hypothetical protein
MKPGWLIKFRLSLGAIVALSAVGCLHDYVDDTSTSPPDPLAGLSTVTDNIQMVSEGVLDRATNSAAAGLAFDFSPFFEEAASKAFQSFAKIDLQFETANENQSLDRSTYNCAGVPFSADWPDFVTSEGANCFQQVATDKRNTTTYPWAIFFVNHTLHNTGTTCRSLYLGTYTKRLGPNQVTTDLTQRFTFVFMTDIQRYEGYNQLGCTNQQGQDIGDTHDQFRNVVNHWVTHGYGAERAGLTEHDGSNNVFHSGTVPSGHSADVMTPMSQASGEYLGHYDVVFDQLPGDSPTIHWTCRSNLLYNRTP